MDYFAWYNTGMDVTRYELSFFADKVRLRFRDDATGKHQDYIFERDQFQEFIDASWLALVETNVE